MENIYLFMLVALAVLALADLIVGVSNDAVNFLNSAIGSKALSFRVIMIVASVGVAAGAIFSSGLMEVARKGIFNPEMFVFSEIMVIFIAVMITDILLLDFFNTLGLPTSTTVSIVFELLGAAVAMALLKIYTGDATEELIAFINVAKATQIVLGIFLSIVFAFSIGAIVQYISRLFLSFHYQEKPKWMSALFGGMALTAITYFIIIKGIKGTPYAGETLPLLGGMTLGEFAETELITVSSIGLVFWTLISMIWVRFWDIYKMIIAVGTFSLALAFAGNDLVNFIGVPIAAWQSYQSWLASGVDPELFSMGGLAAKVATPTIFLFVAGLVMVLTLWTSTKAKKVVKTTIDLSRQDKTEERFESNALSRGLVNAFVRTTGVINRLIPTPIQNLITRQFTQPTHEEAVIKKGDLPAFDNVRASINLTVAAVLISIATSYKLPLSTTYVTFMVAMGTSLADRAWGSDSAVYRVAGVINVVGGWFLTAFIAFTACALLVSFIYFAKLVAIIILLIFSKIILYRNYIRSQKESKTLKEEDELYMTEAGSVQGLIAESAYNVSRMVSRANEIYKNTIHGLATENVDTLKKNKRSVKKLENEISTLRDELYYFIKELDEDSVKASKFFIGLIDCLEDMCQSLELLNKKCQKHVSNKHKKIKYTQIKALKTIENELEDLFYEIRFTFDLNDFDQIKDILPKKEILFNSINSRIQDQVSRTRTEESSPKNTTLFFGILSETKDLIAATMNLIELYYIEYDSDIDPLIKKSSES
ncbi:MAG: inorganic phosphate transporter [Flavobacteriaceae bacterium TMED81]|nr:MAG: inorganic phosphate transporter [Flavobacteriaceae bacterium TMED81]